jgi:hypothetical protein
MYNNMVHLAKNNLSKDVFEKATYNRVNFDQIKMMDEMDTKRNYKNY